MGAVMVFMLVFTTVAVAMTYGTDAAIPVLVAALVLFLIFDVVLASLVANRRWFAWHLANGFPHHPTRVRPSRLTRVRTGPVEPRWPTWADADRAEERVGRPDLDAELRAAGWDRWMADHRLRVLDIAPDPGHPGADLTLYEVTAGRWTGTRLVQVIDASPDERGIHERHALPVPTTCDTALEAIAATWGLTPETYHPQRHT